MLKTVGLSFGVATIAFIVVFIINYRSLLSDQPRSDALPPNFTSYPPSAAWLIALPWAIGIFIVAFVIIWFLRK
jgi:hypothetical protein